MAPHTARFRYVFLALAAAVLPGCAWAPGALCLDHFIHHRNYRAAKVAWLTYGQGDLGPWATTPACKDFETGWRQGYYDVASGMDGKRPIMPPRRYWAARYQNPSGQKRVEAWFAGYELGAVAAQNDGIGNWAYVPTSLGAPPEEPFEEPGSVGYRVLPPPRGLRSEDHGVREAEPVRPADREPLRPAPTREPIRQGAPASETAPRVPQSAAPAEAQPPESEAPPAEVERFPTEALPAAPSQVPGDPFAEEPAEEDTLPETPPVEEPPFEPFDEPEESPDAVPLDEETTPAPAEDPAAKAPAERPTPPVQRTPAEPSEPGRTTPVIPRRELPFPPPRTAPRQPGQPIRTEPAPKGLDTDEPLPESTPDERQGAAAVRRPARRAVVATKTVPAGLGRNRLRLAPAAEDAAPNPPPAGLREPEPARELAIGQDEDQRDRVTAVGAVRGDGASVVAAVHSTSPQLLELDAEADVDKNFETQQDHAPQDADILGGLGLIEVAPEADAPAGGATAAGSQSSRQPPPDEDDDLYFGLQGLTEPPASSEQP